MFSNAQQRATRARPRKRRQIFNALSKTMECEWDQEDLAWCSIVVCQRSSTCQLASVHFLGAGVGGRLVEGRMAHGARRGPGLDLRAPAGAPRHRLFGAPPTCAVVRPRPGCPRFGGLRGGAYLYPGIAHILADLGLNRFLFGRIRANTCTRLRPRSGRIRLSARNRPKPSRTRPIPKFHPASPIFVSHFDRIWSNTRRARSGTG